jgi:hypothetical protein
MRGSRRCQPERFRDSTRRCRSGYHSIGRRFHLMRFTRVLSIDALPVSRSDRAIEFPPGPKSFLRLTRRIGPVNPQRWVG